MPRPLAQTISAEMPRLLGEKLNRAERVLLLNSCSSCAVFFGPSCFQLPIEDLCVLSSRSLLSPFMAAVPASTEDVLMKGFHMLQLESDRIETAQQVGASDVSLWEVFRSHSRIYASR